MLPENARVSQFEPFCSHLNLRSLINFRQDSILNLKLSWYFKHSCGHWNLRALANFKQNITLSFTLSW